MFQCLHFSCLPKRNFCMRSSGNRKPKLTNVTRVQKTPSTARWIQQVAVKLLWVWLFTWLHSHMWNRGELWKCNMAHSEDRIFYPEILFLVSVDSSCHTVWYPLPWQLHLSASYCNWKNIITFETLKRWCILVIFICKVGRIFTVILTRDVTGRGKKIFYYSSEIARVRLFDRNNITLIIRIITVKSRIDCEKA